MASTELSGGARSNLSKLVTEVDEHGRHVVIESESAGARTAFDDGRLLARGLATSGLDVLLVIDRATVNALGSTVELKAAAGVFPRGGSVTVLLVDAYERGRELPVDAGMDTRLVFSLEQVALGIYPALDPEASRAHFHDEGIAHDVRRLLAQSTAIRRYFAQPMYAAAGYTGVEATWVDREDSESELRRLLDVGR